MPELTISRIHHRLQLTGPGQRGPALDMAGALPGALAAALDRRGTAGSAVICVRRVSTRVRMRADSLRVPDTALRQWADGLADAIERDLAGAPDGEKADIVAFRDRGAVLGDVLTRAARGDLTRRWAWTAAGVVRALDPTHPAALIAAVLARHPQQAAGGVRALLSSSPDVLRTWPWPTWVALAQTLVGAAPQVPATDPHEWELVDERLSRLSRLAGTAGFDAVLEFARSAARRAGIEPDGADARRVARAALALTAPELVADPVARGIAERRLAEHRPPVGAGGSSHRGSVAPVEPASTAEPDSGVDTPAGTTTAVGGVLFLHHLLRRLDISSAWCDSRHPLAGRPLVESLAALATAITGADVNDPGVHAFAGRGPHEPLTVLPMTDDEQDAVAATVERLDTALAASLPEPAERLGAGLRRWVVNRAATIDADPGWIEARFPAETTDTDIRKAGLDIDPGFVPYLGCVLRFGYV